MAKLLVSSFIASLTLIDGLVWRQADYDASKMKKFIKGESVKGYVDINVGKNSVRFEDKDRQKFCDILAKTLAIKVLNMNVKDCVLVPIPNSVAVVSHEAEYETIRFARAISSKTGLASISVCDALRWKTTALSSHRGGSRDPQILNENLQVVVCPEHPVILVDDVMTTGAHMTACARKLQAVGVDIHCGLVAVRATWDQREKTLGWIDEVIEINPSRDDYVF